MTKESAEFPPPLRASSFKELFEKEQEAREDLCREARTHEDNYDDSRVGIWYRGVPRMRYQLLPSLLRFPNGLPSERQLYTQFVEHSVPARRDWHALFEMQHYFVPTRLLDWTALFGVALHFALSSDEPLDNPTVWILHPGIVNSKALAPKTLRALFAEGQDRPLNTDDLNESRYYAA